MKKKNIFIFLYEKISKKFAQKQNKSIFGA